MKKTYSLIFLIGFLFAGSCNKFVEVPDPDTEIVRSAVFADDATATAAVLGIYSSMMQDISMASVNTGLYAGLSADELMSFSSDPALGQFYTNTLSPSNQNLTNYWGNAYQYIYGANSVLEGLADNNAVSDAVKTQLVGEAKFIRAFCYFYLANLFGDVPLILTTDYRQNAFAHRTSRNLVFSQIVQDLKEAMMELNEQYIQSDNSPTDERTRPNKWAATALLTRVNLFSGDWNEAIENASAVINQTATYGLLDNLDSVFLLNSKEAIWQLQPVYTSSNATWEGFVYILNDAPSGLLAVSLDSNLVNGFESGDLRRMHWIDSIVVSGFKYYYAYKYKTAISDLITEYYMVLRLSELYLIRAEAKAETGDLSGAAGDLNIVRQRAGLSNTMAADQAGLITAIQTERRFELFTEWGHRWLDLKRTGTTETTIAPVKPGWLATDTLYPIPKYELQNDPNLIQNPGY